MNPFIIAVASVFATVFSIVFSFRFPVNWNCHFMVMTNQILT
nr:MAG TPA: Early E3 14.5 kDa protein [Caudoviricetes sp.]